MYVNLRTGYSFKHAIGKIPDVLDRYVEITEDEFAPIADRGSCYGWHEWEEEALKRELKPVFGVELAVTTEESLYNDSKPGRDYWIFYARDIKSLNHILNKATSQAKYINKGGRPLRTPLLTYEQALDTDRENLFKIMSYRVNVDELNDLLETEDERRTNLYAGFSPALIQTQYLWLRTILEIPFVLTSENKYPRETDVSLYQNICGRASIDKLYPQHILDIGKLINYKKFPIEKFSKFLLECKHWKRTIFEQVWGSRIKSGGIPKIYDMPLYDRCVTRLQELGLYEDKYLERLNIEHTLIRNKNYLRYFQLVTNLCDWAHENMLVGPGRGSAGGSLFCYLLGITGVDPLKYDLSFERFLTEFRTDLPDIDIDFPNRDKVIKYLKQFYGKNHVAKLGTVNMFGPRSCLREAASNMGIKQFMVTPTVDALIEYPAGSEKQKQALKETLETTEAGKKLLRSYPEFEITKAMENHPRHAGVHAAGVIISFEEIQSVGPVDNQNDELILMLNKEGAEENDLLKVDVLGLHTLAIIEDCLSQIGMDKGSLPRDDFDDEDTLQTIRDKKYGGIFQFEGPALQSVCNQFELETFDDMVVVTSIARKGPLSSGAARDWLERRNGKSKVPNLKYEVLQNILAPTKGVLVFQEQVMNICREFAGMTWKNVMAVRKAIGKSKGSEAINKYAKDFENNLLAQNVELEDIRTLWSEILKHGGYSFNKSHAVCYSVISYWCAWLKTYFPREFAAACLTYTKDEDKKRSILIELVQKQGLTYEAVNEKLSDAYRWIVRQGRLVGPFTNVKGIGEKFANQITGARDRGDDISESLLKKIRNNPIPLGDLYPIRQGAVRACDGDLKNAKIFSEITNIEDVVIKKKDHRYTIICTPVGLRIRNVNEERLVEQRGGKLVPKDQPHEFMTGYVKDDTGKLMVSIDRYSWEQNKYIHEMIQRRKFENALYVVQGIIPGGEGKTFKRLSITNFKYLGDMK